MITEWIDCFKEISVTWWWLVSLATWRALPILVLVVAIGLAFRQKLTPWLHALLLTIVLVRLLLPVSISSPLSLHQPIDYWFPRSASDLDIRDRLTLQVDSQASLLPNLTSMDSQVHPHQIQKQPPQFFNADRNEVGYGVVAMIALVVALGLLFRGFVSHLRFAVSLRRCRLLDEQPLIDLLLRECDSLAVGRRPALREVPTLPAPAVFGLFRQTICFPPGLDKTLSEQELRWVLRHELAHIRRYDIPVAVIAGIAHACHWFNPVVGVLVNRLRSAMESAADRLALQNLSPNEAAVYGKLLLRFAEGNITTRREPTLGLISFSSGSYLKQRVEMLVRDSRPLGMPTKFLSVGVAMAIAFVGLTDAKEATDPKKPPAHLATNSVLGTPVPPSWNDPYLQQEGDGPAFIQTYAIESILEAMPKSPTSSQKIRQEQLADYLRFPSSLKGKIALEGTTLSAELTTRQHQLLKQTLEMWKKGEPKQIALETRFVHTDIQNASSIDWTRRSIEGLTVKGLSPAIAARIDETELMPFLRSVAKDNKSTIQLAPKVVLFDGQTAGITDQVQRPFVTGLDPHADGRIQPVVSVVDEGLRFRLTPRMGEGDNITLDFEVTASNIGKVSYANLPLRTSRQAEPKFTVQVPAMEQYEVSASVKLAAGESIVVAIPRVFTDESGSDAATTMIVVWTPRAMPPPGR